MPALIYDPLPVELEALLERRRELEQDRRDEVWEGVLHMIPPASHEHERIVMLLGRVLGPRADAAGLELTGAIGIGVEDDYRVPDLALHRPPAAPMWHPTAALAIEVVSPRDDSRRKFDFYAAHSIDELLIVDPGEQRIDWFELSGDQYAPVERSRVIECSPSELAEQLGWPPS